MSTALHTPVEWEGHPLSESFRRLRALDNYLGAAIGSPRSGQERLDRLFDDPAGVEEIVMRQARIYDDNRRVAATFVAGEATWAFTAAPVALMVLERRAIAPECSRAFVSVDDKGQLSECVYDDPAFCVVEDDELSDHPRSSVVHDLPGLYDWGRVRLEAFMTPLVDQLASVTRLSRRFLWAQVASSWGSTIVWAASAAGNSGLALTEAPAFVAGKGKAFARKPTFYALEHNERQLVAMRRAACCLAYKLPDERYCGSCPLISDEERNERFCREAEADGE